MSEFILALDAGMTGVTTVIARAAAHEESQVVAPSAARRERAGIPVLAFITDDGDAVFGAEAVELGRARPERLVHQFTRCIGDPVPTVVGGFAVSAHELFARMVLWILDTASAECGERPSTVAIAHPSSWSGHRAAIVRERLREFGVDDLLMMPSAVVVAQQLASASSRGHTVGVYDLGGSTFEATLLRGGRVLGEPQRMDVGGEDVDAALLDHVLALLGRDPGDRGDRAGLLAARAAVVRAKEGLSFSADVSVPITVDGCTSSVRVTRSELDAMASAPIASTLGALEQAMESTGVDAADVDEIVLVGGSARIPLVAQILSAQFDRPLTVPADPQFAVAESIARIASAQLQRRSAALAVSARTAALQPAARRLGSAASPPSTGRIPQSSRGAAAAVRPTPIRIPYGAAAAVVAAGLIIATGMVFAATTPLGGGSDAADGAASEEPRRGEPRSLVRTVSEYSADGVTQTDEALHADPGAGDTDPSDTVEHGEPPEDRAQPRRGGPSIDAPGSEPAGTSTTRSAPGVDPAPAGGATPSTSAPIIQPTPDPAPPATQTPPPVDAGPQPEPTSDPVADPEPTPVPDPEPVSDPTPTSDPVADPTPTSDPAPAPDPAPASDPAPSSDPAVTPPQPEPEATESPSPTEPPREATAA